MPRSRNLKPGFFSNDLLAETGPLGMLLFEGLWCQADRAGRLEDRPLRLKASILPYFDADVGALLDELAQRGFVTRYSANGTAYIEVVNFGKHQTPHIKEPASAIPAPDEHGASPVQTPDEHPRIPDTGYLIADTGLLTAEDGGSGGSAPAAEAVPPTEQESASAPPTLHENDDAPSPVPAAPSPAKRNDGRVYALVDAFAKATKRRPDQIQGRDRKETADAFKPLVDDAVPEDVIGCVVYLRTDPFWREAGRLTARKVAATLPEWIADGKPNEIEAGARASPNGRLAPGQQAAMATLGLKQKGHT